MLNTTTAGNFHPHNGDAFDIVIRNDLGKLFSVVHIVQLWASNQRDAITDKIVVEIPVGISCTVRQNSFFICRTDKYYPKKKEPMIREVSHTFIGSASVRLAL